MVHVIHHGSRKFRSRSLTLVAECLRRSRLAVDSFLQECYISSFIGSASIECVSSGAVHFFHGRSAEVVILVAGPYHNGGRDQRYPFALPRRSSRRNRGHTDGDA